MDPAEMNTRLSRIQTLWTVVFEAHKGEGEPVSAAQRQLLMRYRGAIYRYLLGTVRDAAVAEDLAQDFAVRFLQGQFKRADPERGRFRDFVKTALRNLVIDYWRKQGHKMVHMPEAAEPEAAPSSDVDDLDQPFLDQWREELLARTWDALAEAQTAGGQPYHTVLRWKTEQPDVRSAQLAERLGAQQGRTVSDTALRKLLFRARQLFADLLVQEVARSLGTPETDKLEEELIELGLLDYCRSALARRNQPE
jgi:RNA polymerase sigma-70 factor (ECF subfamily)